MVSLLESCHYIIYMRLAAILNAHENTDLVLDTLDAVRTWVTDDILVVVDGAHWKKWGKDAKLPAHKLEGFIHNYYRGPYRNVTLGLKEAVNKWPDVDWYCYLEPDTLFASDSFKEDLAGAEKRGTWCVGNDPVSDDYNLSLLNSILDDDIKCTKYLLGCCVFYKAEFIHKLRDIGFFEKFLYLTNDFQEGFFPEYTGTSVTSSGGHDFTEHLYPTLAHHFGGKVDGLAGWSSNFNLWRGNFKKYPMRWRPDLEEHEDFPEASIMHPLKTADHPLRTIHRIRRRKRQNVGR